MTPKYPDICVTLVGESDNSFAIIGKVSSALKRAGVSNDEIAQYRKEATSGDFNNLINVTMQWVEHHDGSQE